MAGDFIFWSKGLAKKREVIAIASSVAQDRRWVASALMEFWEWVDSESADGFIPAVADSASLQLIFADVPAAFWAALEEAGWIKFRNGGLHITNFDRWLSNSAKKRLADAKRKRAEYATRKRDGPSASASDDSPKKSGDSILSSPLTSAFEDGGLGEGESPLLEVARFLSTEWCGYLTRRKHGFSADKAEDITPQMAELLRVGFSKDELLAEIRRKDRLKNEQFFQFQDRLLKARTASAQGDVVKAYEQAKARADREKK